ncbi:hypothetical protein BDW22DRAFT_304768 [Trametopsis cervina]|nr:hypothetical protein BDW22DRAFT_304768 [Trametopsis cervina]
MNRIPSGSNASFHALSRLLPAKMLIERSPTSPSGPNTYTFSSDAHGASPCANASHRPCIVSRTRVYVHSFTIGTPHASSSLAALKRRRLGERLADGSDSSDDVCAIPERSRGRPQKRIGHAVCYQWLLVCGGFVVVRMLGCASA